MMQARFQNFFTDFWNVIDICALCIYFIGLVLRFIPNPSCFLAARYYVFFVIFEKGKKILLKKIFFCNMNFNTSFWSLFLTKRPHQNNLASQSNSVSEGRIILLKEKKLFYSISGYKTSIRVCIH